MRNVLRIPYRLRLFILVPRARRFWLQIKPSDSGDENGVCLCRSVRVLTETE